MPALKSADARLDPRAILISRKARLADDRTGHERELSAESEDVNRGWT